MPEPASRIRVYAVTLLSLLSLAGAFSVTGCFARQYRSNPRVAIVNGDPIVQMQPPGKMPSIALSRLVAGEMHSDRPDALDRVLGVLVGSEARAYPVGLLDRFEVVNDASPDFPYVVVRCALTGVAALYDRRVAGQTLTFENSGALWRDTLVLQDRETQSYWSAATGRGLAGALAGEDLRAIPAVLTKTRNWERQHPESLYLDLDRSTIVPLMMRLYEASPAQGVSGRKTEDRRYKPKQEVFVLARAGEAFAFRAAEIRAAGDVETALAGEEILIEWDERLETPRAYVLSSRREEIPAVPMYWFAVDRHYKRVRTLGEEGGAGRALAPR